MDETTDLNALRTAREAEGYYELELFEEALQRARSLLSEGKMELFALAMKAECLRSLGRWAEGIEAFEEVLRGEPRDVSAYVGLGWCQKRSGRLDLATHAMERLLEQCPGEPIGLFNLACYCCLAGERSRALELLRASIEKDPEYRKLAVQEEDFALLRGEPAFEEILAT